MSIVDLMGIVAAGIIVTLLGQMALGRSANATEAPPEPTPLDQLNDWGLAGSSEPASPADLQPKHFSLPEPPPVAWSSVGFWGTGSTITPARVVKESIRFYGKDKGLCPVCGAVLIWRHSHSDCLCCGTSYVDEEEE